ncbi:hypothetical protein I547_0470 [Mycobacterium kansasii 824]|nr:hypothetical protein I547_0470 [Mycobacterium kansasii 824]
MVSCELNLVEEPNAGSRGAVAARGPAAEPGAALNASGTTDFGPATDAGNDGESSLFGYHAPNPTSLADLRSQARGRPLCDQIAAENVLSTACVLLRNLGFTAPEKG